MKILIAEDSGICDQLVEAFADCEDMLFEITAVKSGFRWNELIEKGMTFDAVIADVIMPVEQEDLDFHQTGLRLVRKQIESGLVKLAVILSVRVPELQQEISDLGQLRQDVKIIAKSKGGYPAPETIVRTVIDELRQ